MCVLFCFVSGKYCAPTSVYNITAVEVCTRGRAFGGYVGPTCSGPTRSRPPRKCLL